MNIILKYYFYIIKYIFYPENLFYYISNINQFLIAKIRSFVCSFDFLAAIIQFSFFVLPFLIGELLVGLCT